MTEMSITEVRILLERAKSKEIMMGDINVSMSIKRLCQSHELLRTQRTRWKNIAVKRGDAMNEIMDLTKVVNEPE